MIDMYRGIHYRHIKKLCREAKKPTLSEFYYMMQDIDEVILLSQVAESVVYVRDGSGWFDYKYLCNAEIENPLLWIGFHGENVHYAISFKLIDLVRILIKPQRKSKSVITSPNDEFRRHLRRPWIFDAYVKHLKWQCKQHGVKNGLDKFRISRDAWRYSAEKLNIEMTRIIATYIKISELWNNKTKTLQ